MTKLKSIKLNVKFTSRQPKILRRRNQFCQRIEAMKSLTWLSEEMHFDVNCDQTMKRSRFNSKFFMVAVMKVLQSTEALMEMFVHFSRQLHNHEYRSKFSQQEQERRNFRMSWLIHLLAPRPPRRLTENSPKGKASRK